MEGEERSERGWGAATSLASRGREKARNIAPKDFTSWSRPLAGESGAEYEGVVSTPEATKYVPGVHMSGWSALIVLKPTLVTPYYGFNEN